MEILNQNQRRSAMWRLAAIAVFILSMFCTVAYSMHKSYASLGMDDLEILQTKYKKDKNIWEGKENKMANEIKALKKELEDCKAKSGKPNDLLELCKERIELKDDRINEIEQQLTRCEAKYAAATSY